MRYLKRDPNQQTYYMKYTKSILAAVVPISVSVADVLRKLKIHQRQHGRISRLITEYGLDRSHFQSGFTVSKIAEKKHWSEHLVVGKVLKSTVLRRVLLESGRPYICVICGQGPSWNGEVLVLQVDHENGQHDDNRPENVRFLCPNCHSQTPTHSKIKRKLKEKPVRLLKQSTTPSIEELRELIWTMPATRIAQRFGVSDKSVEKWCKKYGLSKPGPGYWSKLSS